MPKVGVESVEEITESFSMARITSKWPMVVFFSELNVSVRNARILLLSTNNQKTRYRYRGLFLKDLTLQLIKKRYWTMFRD